MNYIEFRLSVPISDLHDDDSHDADEVRELFAALGITVLPQSLREQYDSYYDYVAAPYPNGALGRIGRGDVRKYLSEQDEGTYLAINMFLEPTDSMGMVELHVRCLESNAPKVLNLLTRMRDRAEVASALLQGNLGIHDELAVSRFPR